MSSFFIFFSFFCFPQFIHGKQATSTSSSQAYSLLMLKVTF